MRARLLVTAAILAFASTTAATSALADGDPASDVLATQTLFLPQDAGLTPTQQTQLQTLLAEAQHHGYPIRVALIASQADLGTVTALWRQPQQYARFLGQELSLLYKGPLLVVMPNGLGFSHPGQPAATPPPALTAIANSNQNRGLAPIAMIAIQRLAAASGHPLPNPAGAGATASPPGSDSTTPWIAFAVGALLILAAWTASLRARPIRHRHKRQASATN
jgi:hypothetical protein